MNKSILIHTKNTPHTLQAKFNQENIIEFDYSNSEYKNIDEYISNTTIEALKNKKIDLIYIKDNLSASYLELYGLRVAYHVRLTTELKFVPIVILSDLDGYTLNKLEPMARIIFTKNVFIEPNSTKTIEKFQDKVFSEFNENNYKNSFLDLVRVDSPENSTNHSIANKWAIFKWASSLKCESEVIKKNQGEIENQLYFKYLKALHKHQDNKLKDIIESTKEGKVLLMDDEWDKGWTDILKTALTKDGLEFKPFITNYKDRDDFNDLTYKKIANENPDVVILDLRLLDADHKNEDKEDIDNYSGVKILQKIHEINSGIQVIMLTATSKSTILEKLYEKKILGYIKKEHPDDKSIDTVENINKFVRLVDKGLERKYLKKVFLIQKELLVLPLLQIEFSFNMDENDKKLLELKNTISKIFETLDSNIPRPFIYGMLTLYKCIETICDYFIYEYYDKTDKKQKAYWRSSDKLISNNGNASVNNKTRNILRLLEINENDTIRLIDELSCSRNYEIHPGEIKPACQERVILKPNETHIIPWFELIKTILNKIGK
ncbi:MAG: response regulator [Sulfurimonas sp.]|nr:response regulator [Sulfurimonas sp.]